MFCYIKKPGALTPGFCNNLVFSNLLDNKLLIRKGICLICYLHLVHTGFQTRNINRYFTLVQFFQADLFDQAPVYGIDFYVLYIVQGIDLELTAVVRVGEDGEFAALACEGGFCCTPSSIRRTIWP